MATKKPAKKPAKKAPESGHVIELQVSNYKGVKEMRVVLQPGTNIVGGKNRAGKSSGLDALANIFGGKKLTPKAPVRMGTDGFKLQAVLKELGVTIVREGKIGEDGKLREKLVVSDAAGFKAERPQELLDKLLDAHAIRPEAFDELKPKEQVELLRSIAGLDFAEADAQYQDLYNKRRDANVARQSVHGQIEAMGPVLGGTPDEPISVGALLEELAEIDAINRANDEARRVLEEEVRRLATSKGEVERLTLELVEAKKRVVATSKAVDNARAAVDGLEYRDSEAIKTQLDNAEEINAAVTKKKQRAELVRRYEDLCEAWAACDGAMAKLVADKEAKIAGAGLPVDGLSFNDDGVLLNGLPIDQASQQERSRVSVGVGLALSPKVRLILVREGSLYDDDNLANLNAMALEHDAIVVVERVMNDKEQAEAEGAVVFMEDGVGYVQEVDGD